jgi:hypothetical protein
MLLPSISILFRKNMVLCILVAFLAACSTPEQSMSLDPNLPIAQAMQTPMPLSSKVWGGEQINQVCLEVEQEFPGVEEPPVADIEKVVSNILKLNGVQVVPGGGDCSVTLSIQISAVALSRKYKLQNLGGVIGTCFTGASVSGKLSLISPGRRTLNKYLRAELTPPKNTSECLEAISRATYEYTLIQAVLKGLVKVWGPRAILPVLLLPGNPSGLTPAEDFGIKDLLKDMGKDAEVYIPLLLRGVTDQDANIRWSAVRHLGYIARQPERVVPALIQALGDPDDHVRSTAAFSLGYFEAEAEPAIDALIAVLSDEDNDVRWSAAVALRKIGVSAKRAVPALIGLLEDESPLMFGEAEDALKAITGQDLGRDAQAWRRWYEANK